MIRTIGQWFSEAVFRTMDGLDLCWLILRACWLVLQTAWFVVVIKGSQFVWRELKEIFREMWYGY